MANTKIRPDQAKTLEVFDDQKAAGAVTLEDTTLTLEGFLQGVISQVNRLIHTTEAGNDWHADLTAPTTFEGGTKRGVDTLNQALHTVERKRLLTPECDFADVAVPAAQNWVSLGVGELPVTRTAAVGAVTTLGTVVAAHSGTYGTHSLDVVTGANSLNPKNIVPIVDGSTRDPILSSGRRIHALMQSENATDGHTILSNAPNQVQLSFVTLNGTGDGLIACPVPDIEGLVINFCSVARIPFQSFDEQVLLSGALFDNAAGGGGGPSAPWFEDVYAASLGQITFFLSSVPSEPATVSVHVNGVEAVEGADYVLSGLTLTWLNTEFSLVATDVVVIRYK